MIGTDGPFGNLVLNVPAEIFAKPGYSLGEIVSVQVGTRDLHLPFVKTFSDVAIGQPLFYIDSRERLSLGVNQRSFAAVFGAHPSEVITIPTRP